MRPSSGLGIACNNRVLRGAPIKIPGRVVAGNRTGVRPHCSQLRAIRWHSFVYTGIDVVSGYLCASYNRASRILNSSRQRSVADLINCRWRKSSDCRGEKRKRKALHKSLFILLG